MPFSFSSVLISPDSAACFSPAPFSFLFFIIKEVFVGERSLSLSLCSERGREKKKAFKYRSLGKVLFHHLSHALSCGQQVGTEWLLRLCSERERMRGPVMEKRREGGREGGIREVKPRYVMLALGQVLLTSLHLKQRDEIKMDRSRL